MDGGGEGECREGGSWVVRGAGFTARWMMLERGNRKERSFDNENGNVDGVGGGRKGRLDGGLGGGVKRM